MNNGIIVPMVCGLLPNTTKKTYRRFFSVVIDNVRPCAVRVLYTDFEIAAINAARDVISDIRIQGCFFHLAQSVHRKLCALGFQARYGTDEAFAVKKIQVDPDLAALANAAAITPDSRRGTLVSREELRAAQLFDGRCQKKDWTSASLRVKYTSGWPRSSTTGTLHHAAQIADGAIAV
ncbi:hypothetical protein HPB47_016946 [Ixodes persulcatus]|uniref:Uncharacterized protein n=1 Tax=Ixodes persulcatus TaxID=34615 RepID=A0AC60QQL1_IXOPE|nr:hypothetical protein HPB47_016946 [Ixodes persulcatus]